MIYGNVNIFIFSHVKVALLQSTNFQFLFLRENNMKENKNINKFQLINIILYIIEILHNNL